MAGSFGDAFMIGHYIPKSNFRLDRASNSTELHRVSSDKEYWLANFRSTKLWGITPLLAYLVVYWRVVKAVRKDCSIKQR